MTFSLDPTWRRPGAGETVIGGSPLTLFRLSAAGRRVAEALEQGAELPTGHEPLTDRLLDAGAIHPVPTPAGGPSPSDVTLVIPTHGRDPSHAGRIAALVAAAGPVGRVVIVDDASAVPVTARDLDTTPGGPPVDVILRASNGGPGAAREDGWRAAGTALIAFVDDDVTLPAGWLEPLLAHFGDPRVGLVAPRVRSVRGTGELARFDETRSPLDLGPEAGRIRSGTRISYVPAATLVCRAEALDSVGGFDPTLRYGEDVDLVWRFDEEGWRCRYEPAVEVWHAPRDDVRGWLHQRAAYGSSAAPLALRHPGALAPVRMSGWSLGVWALVAAGHPVGGTALAAGTTGALVRKLTASGALPLDEAVRESARLAGLGHLYAGRQLAHAVVRAWWPIGLVLAVASRRARRVLLAAALVPALLDQRSEPERSLARDLGRGRALGLRLLDDLAYGWGLWQGVLRHRTADPLLPRLTSFPGRLRVSGARTGRAKHSSGPAEHQTLGGG